MTPQQQRDNSIIEVMMRKIDFSGMNIGDSKNSIALVRCVDGEYIVKYVSEADFYNNPTGRALE
jgi:hypothetical protein